MAIAPDVEIAVEAGPPQAAVSWGSIFAGTVIAAGLTLLLMVLGAGLGLSVVSPWPGAGVAASTFAVSGIIWLIVTQWLSSAAGGYVAGRLRTRRPDIQADESFFRDSAHGLAAWATASIIVAVVAGSVAASAVGAGTRAVATVAAGAAEGAGEAAGDVASSVADPTAYFVDTLFRSGPDASAAATPAAPAAAAPAASAPTPAGITADTGAARSEATRILVHGLTGSEFPADDRTYLASLVSRTAGITQDEAATRVDQTIAALNSAKAEAQKAADDARKAAVTASLLAALALFIGAFIASAAAVVGGYDRDAPYTNLGMRSRPTTTVPVA